MIVALINGELIVKAHVPADNGHRSTIATVNLTDHIRKIIREEIERAMKDR
jgi:hypothetical protein